MKAMITLTSGIRHALVAGTEALLVAAIVASLALALSPVYKPAGFIAGTGIAEAARGGHASTSGSNSISVADGPFGGTTTAYVSGSSTWVHVVCATTSGAQMIGWEPLVGGQADIALGPTPSWSSGTASCKADAGKFDSRSRFQVAVSTTFHVN